MDAGCFSDWQTDIPEPSNWNIIKSMLFARKKMIPILRRKPMSPQDEAEIRASLFPIFRSHESDYAEDLPFDNLVPLVPGISDTKPGMFYGSHTTQLKPHTRSALDQMIIPSKQPNPNVPMLPNFILEAEGLDGSFTI